MCSKGLVIHLYSICKEDSIENVSREDHSPFQNNYQIQQLHKSHIKSITKRATQRLNINQCHKSTASSCGVIHLSARQTKN